MLPPIAVTILNAAKVTGLSRTGIYDALNTGKLTAKKAGRRTLIPYDDLQIYLQSLPDYHTEA
jgi:excisionase family DNA binding protein